MTLLKDEKYVLLRAFDVDAERTLARFGLTLRRSRASFVSYDGAGTLNVAPDEELDGDDTLLQIVIHELAHAWVEGEASFCREDWGLDNVATGHLDREYAALRLQLALLAPHHLERALHPTTTHRWFYQATMRRGGPQADVLPVDCEAAARSLGADGITPDEAFEAARRSVEPYARARRRLEEDPRSAAVRALLQRVADTVSANGD